MNILEARDRRVLQIENLINQGYCVVSLRCNYPGSEKDNRYTQFVIKVMNEVIVSQFPIIKIIDLNDGEGPVKLYGLKISGQSIKEKTITIEDSHPLGRLVDIDVYEDTIRSLSRNEMKKLPRKCFLCDEEAFKCIVHKRHSLKELTDYFVKKVEAYDE